VINYEQGDDSVVVCKTGVTDVTVEVGHNPGYFYQPLGDVSTPLITMT